MISDYMVDKAIEAHLLKAIAELLPDTLTTRREFLIQLDKLERIIMQPDAKLDRMFLGNRATEKSVKKIKKRMGESVHRVQQQVKIVRELGDKLFKEFLRTQRKLTNAEYRDWKRQLDEGIEQSKQRWRRSTLMHISEVKTPQVPKLT